MEVELGRGRGRGRSAEGVRPFVDESKWLTFPGGESREAKKASRGYQQVVGCEDKKTNTFGKAKLFSDDIFPVRLYDSKIHQNLNYTSNIGERGQDILKAEMKQTHDEMMARADIRDALLSMDPKDLTIVVINISMCLTSRGVLYIPAEIGLTAFSVEGGIIDNYWTLIDPYCIPMGFGFIVKNTMCSLGLPFPPYSNRFQNYGRCIDGLERFLKKHENPVTNKTIVFCLTKDVRPFKCALDWLYDQIGQEHNINFGLIGDIVRPLSDIGITRRAARENIEASILFAKYLNHTQFYLIENMPNDLHKTIPSCPAPTTQQMIQESKSSGYSSNPLTDEGLLPLPPPLYERKLGYFRYVPTQEILNHSGYNNQNRMIHPERGYYNGQEVEDYLESQELSFDSEIACLYHMQPEHEDRMRYCPLHVTNRFAYCILASLTGHFGVDPIIPGLHRYLKGSQLIERKRRCRLMRECGYTNYKECVEFSFDGKPPAMFNTNVSDELHPKGYNRPE